MIRKTSLGMKRLARAERQVIQLERKLAEEGETIDSEIREAIVVLTAFGIHTRGSCAGHVDDISRGAGPFIDVIPLPEAQWGKLWTREGRASRRRREFLKKHRISTKKYTKREKDFLDKNLKEMHLLDKSMSRFTFRLITLLERFYKNRKTTTDARLILWSPLNRQIMIISQGTRAAHYLSTNERARRIKRYQKELFDFVAFVRKLVLQGKTFRDICF